MRVVGMMSNSNWCVSSCVMRPYSWSGGSSIGRSIRCCIGCANGAPPSWGAAGRDVLLLELAVGLEQDHRHFVRQVVLQIRADLLIRTLGVGGDPFEVLLQRRIVVNLEVVGRIDVPLELVVMDVVLAEVRNHLRLRRCGGAQAGDEPGHPQRDGRRADREGHSGTHRQGPRKSRSETRLRSYFYGT